MEKMAASIQKVRQLHSILDRCFVCYYPRKFVNYQKTFHSVSNSSMLEVCSISNWYISRRYQYRFSRGRYSLDTEDKCKDFAVSLFPNERALVLAELQKIQELYQTKDKDEIMPPSKAQLRLVALSNGIPFIGFGFLDNAIMIVAGDYIDLTLGITLGISTMAAAALGNLISDLAGVGLAGYVESLATKVGVQPKNLTPEQADMRKTRWMAGIGRAVGLTIGCLLGMFPLLFLETREETEEPKSSIEGAVAGNDDDKRLQSQG